MRRTIAAIVASGALLFLSGFSNSSAQSRPFTTETAYGSKILVRSSYSPLSAAAQTSSAYRRMLGRSPTIFEMANLLRDAKPGLQSQALVGILLSTEFAQRIGNSDSQFINAAYSAILKRAPLPVESQFQLGRLSGRSASRAQIALDLVTSCEHAGLLAQQAYSLLLGRDAPAGSAAVWCPGVQAGQLDVLWLDLLSSNEYYARNGTSARSFAIALYRDVLWRDAGTAEVDNIVSLLVNHGLTRRQVAGVFMNGGEFSAHWAYICAGQWVDVTGHIATDGAVNACIASASRLELPAGVFRIENGLSIFKSDFILTTEGLYGRGTICEKDTPACARFVAATGALFKQPLMQVFGDVSRVTIDHVIFDGNREKRTDLVPLCGKDGGDGRNVVIMNGDDNKFQFSASVNTACKTALAVGTGGTPANPARRTTIVHNVIRNSGAGFDRVNNQWSDGMTLSFLEDSVVGFNRISESSDVALIFGNSPRTTVMWNVIEQLDKRAFAGMMDTNWNIFEKPKTWGDSRGLIVYKNEVLCGDNCDFGIQIGLGPWSDPTEVSNLRILGGWYEQNNVVSSKQGINVDLAGTPDYPVTLISNTVNRLGYGVVRHDTPIGYYSLPFNGTWSTRPTSAINISKPWDHSFVSTGGETPHLEAYPWS